MLSYLLPILYFQTLLLLHSAIRFDLCNGQSNAQLLVESELESVPSSAENTNMHLDIKGKSTGDMTIDLKTGVIITNKDKKHLEGVMTIKNQGNEMKMPMIIDATSEIIRLK